MEGKALSDNEIELIFRKVGEGTVAGESSILGSLRVSTALPQWIY